MLRPDDLEGAQGSDDVGEEVWSDELGPNHCITHLPKSSKCNICKQAKLLAKRHRRLANKSSNLQEVHEAIAPKGFMERIAIDHMYAKQHLGFDGEEVVLMCVDLFSGLCAACPAGDRSTENVEEALRFFAGRNRPIVTVVSDRAPEFAKAISNCGFVSDPAPPRDVLHNPHAESAIRTFRQGVSTLMLQSGLNQQYWPYAIKYFEFAYNVLSPPSGPAIRNSEEAEVEAPASKYEAAVGYPYEGFLIPFGALVWYKDLDKQGFEPNGSPAIYLGPEVVAGMRYKATHRVFPLKRVKEGVFQAVWTRNLALPNGDWTFPLAVKDAGDGPVKDAGDGPKAIDFQGDGPKTIEFRPDPLGSFEERVAAQDSD